MRVFQFPGQISTAPKRATFGITFALRGGDVLHPLGKGDWFRPPYFSRILRFWCPIPILPWISWNLWGWRGYCGMKIFGVDSDAYKLWPAMSELKHEVYPGSQALQFSIRLRISD